jgi:hypothetical protein
MKILLGNCNAKVGSENIFIPTIENEGLHQDSAANGDRVVNFATSKNSFVKNKVFLHRNIHKYIWTSSDGKTHNQIDHILIERRWHTKMEYIEAVLQLFIDFKKAYDSIRREVLYSIPMEFGIPMKLVSR